MSDMIEMDGVVEKVGHKRIGKRTYYNFFLEDDDTMYRTGTTETDVQEGDTVAFEYEDGEYGAMVDLDSLEIEEGERKPKRRSSSKKKATSKKRPAKASRGRGSRDVADKSNSSNKLSKDDYYKNKEVKDENRQKIISFQAAYNTALNILNSQLGLGLVTLGAANAKAGKKLEVFNELLEAKAQELFGKFNAAVSLSATVAIVDDVEDDDQVDGEVSGEDEEWDD